MQERATQALAKWIRDDALPFSIVEQEGFKQFCAALNRNFSSPTRHKMRKMVCFTALIQVVYSFFR